VLWQAALVQVGRGVWSADEAQMRDLSAPGGEFGISKPETFWAAAKGKRLLACACRCQGSTRQYVVDSVHINLSVPSPRARTVHGPPRRGGGCGVEVYAEGALWDRLEVCSVRVRVNRLFRLGTR
jgi:hypothetical protein